MIGLLGWVYWASRVVGWVAVISIGWAVSPFWTCTATFTLLLNLTIKYHLTTLLTSELEQKYVSRNQQ